MANENGKSVFTKRDGTQVEVKDFVIPAHDVVAILRLKEDFEQRGEHLSLYGVVSHLLSQGATTTRNYWKSQETAKNRRDFAKSAVLCFGSDGSIKDPEQLAKLAAKYGLVAGTQREV
jgi:hypothetical protein